MSKELIVSTGKHETRVAILEDDQLVEIFHEREKEYSLAGSIHKGRVTRVLPGMQSAFVDIGLERDAFLYVSDFFEDNDEYDAVVSTVEDKVLKMEKGGASSGAERGGEQHGFPPEKPEFPVQAEAAESESHTPSLTAAPPAAERREEQSREGRPDRAAGPGADRSADRGGDRSGDRGRGRRGRRRRGGRAPSGLPDSKFFTPGTEDDAEPQGEAEAGVPEVAAPEVTAASTHVPARHVPVSDDFTLLPGESLAKYVLPGESLAK
ncbi:MAG: hypothetical protein ABUS51_04740 [Acidobacteriota bacterium]